MQMTIGMAVYDDFDGVYFTIQSIRLHHDLQDVEFIVVDNNPASPAGRTTGDFVRGWVPRGRYIPMPEPKGTTQTRQRVYDEAAGEAVVVMDPHVLLTPGVLGRLVQFYRKNPETLDLAPLNRKNIRSA